MRRGFVLGAKSVMGDGGDGGVATGRTCSTALALPVLTAIVCERERESEGQ